MDNRNRSMHMGTSLRTCATAGMVLLAAWPAARAQSLGQFLEQAATNDPVFASARAQRDADLYYRDIGAAGLRPSVTVGGSAGSTAYKRQDFIAGAGVTRSYSFGPATASFQVAMPLLNPERQASATEGELRAQRAEVVWALAEQDLARRVTQVWFNYLLDLHQLALAQAQLTSYQSQREQAQRMRDAGLATRTDVEETTSRAEVAAADLAAARADLEVKAREFARVVGAAPPAGIEPETLKFNLAALVTGSSVDDWVALARERSAMVLAQRLALDIARNQIKRAKAGLMPTLSLIASYQDQRTTSYLKANEFSSQVALQLSMNLYDGGANRAQVGQSDALAAKAESDVRAAQDDMGSKMAEAALTHRSSTERVAALEKAVLAAAVTLQGMEAGLKAGLRTNSDVLNAKQQWFSVRRDLARERYTLLLRDLDIRLLSGEGGAIAVAATAQALVAP